MCFYTEGRLQPTGNAVELYQTAGGLCFFAACFLKRFLHVGAASDFNVGHNAAIGRRTQARLVSCNYATNAHNADHHPGFVGNGRTPSTSYSRISLMRASPMPFVAVTVTRTLSTLGAGAASAASSSSVLG